MAKSRGKVRVGIVGLGRSGWDIHTRLLRPLKSKYKIVAVADRNVERMKEANAEFGCAMHSSFKKLIADPNVELVVNATPNHMHADYSIQAMKAGKHVVCEKPMATSVKDADKMIAASKRYKRKLTIFQNRRYEPTFLKVKEILESGVLGRIVLIRYTAHSFGRRWDWQTLKRYGGGTLNNTCPHTADQMLLLFGEEKPNVYCERDRMLTLGDADDHVRLILSGKKSPTIEMEVTSGCAYPQQTWLVMATQGGLSGGGGKLNWKYFNPKTLPKRKLSTEPTPDRSYNSDTGIKWIEKSWDASKAKKGGEIIFYHELYKTLRNGKKVPVTPESVRRQIWVLDQCRKLAPV